jgi:dienelactone hydrolase
MVALTLRWGAVFLLFMPIYLLAAIQSQCSFDYRILNLSYHGHTIPVEIYQPSGNAPHPAILMIHGSAGVFTREKQTIPDQDNFGELTFAKNCYTVILPHYLASVGLNSIQSRPQIEELMPTLLDALQVVFHQFLQGASASVRVGVYGESLGGYLAVALASREPQVVAVSEFSGGLPQTLMAVSGRQTKILIQHGADDTLVPVVEADALANYYRRITRDVQVRIYSGQGHYFDTATRNAVLDESLTFFNANLKPVPWPFTATSGPR